MKKDSLALYSELKNKVVATAKVDKEILSELLDATVAELKTQKTSAFVNRLYTSCMQYAYFPAQDKKTMAEIRIRPVDMGMSGTDAMILLEMISMKVECAECEKTESFKLACDRLFSAYMMRPGAVRIKLDKVLEKMNLSLCQQGALAHFGKNANVEETKHRERGGERVSVSESTGTKTEVTPELRAAVEEKAGAAIAAALEEKAAAVMTKTREKCANMTREAQKKADTILKEAKIECENMTREAQQKADEIIKAADKKCADMTAAAKKQAAEALVEGTSDLEREINKLKSKYNKK